jgi:hypothetical protein
MVGRICSSELATNKKMVSAGGSSISFNNLFPSLPRYSGIHMTSTLKGLSKLLKLVGLPIPTAQAYVILTAKEYRQQRK